MNDNGSVSQFLLFAGIVFIAFALILGHGFAPAISDMAIAAAFSAAVGTLFGSVGMIVWATERPPRYLR